MKYIVGATQAVVLLVGACALGLWSPARPPEELRRDLARAVRERRTPTALKLLREGADPNIYQDGLSYAAPDGKRDVHAPTLLMRAVHDADVALVRALLLHGADPNARGMDFYTYEKMPEDQDSFNDRITALHEVGQFSGMSDESSAPSKRRELTPRENRTLYNSAARRYVDITRLLLDHGARIDERDGTGRTPLSRGLTFHASASVVQLLLQRGAKLNARDTDGEAAFVAAEFHDYIRPAGEGMAVLRVLARFKPNFNERDSHEGTTLLHQHSDQPAIVRFLVEHGTDMNAKDKTGASGWSEVARHFDYVRDIKLLRWLIARGADLKTRDNKGNSLLITSCATQGNFPIVDLLLQHGASPNESNNRGTTALMAAARGTYEPGNVAPDSGLESVKRLIALGAKINARDKNGATALDYAEAGRRFEATMGSVHRFLLQHGAKRGSGKPEYNGG